MKTTFKTLTVAAACALPIAKSHAWPVMTPEQLKAALEAIREESKTRNDFPFKIEEIKYDYNEIPQSIKGSNITPEYINAELLKRIKPFSLNIRDKKDLEATGSRLGELSKPLSADTLKERGVDTDRLEKLGIKEVREITFRSILDSRFFTNAQRKKADVWFNSKGELEKAIEDYANNYPYDLFLYRCELHNQTTTGDKQPTVTAIDQTENRHIWGTYFVPRTEGMVFERGEGLREKIKSSLKNMLRYKNGKEKVILSLLLDEATPKEHRLKWGGNDDNAEGSYQPNNCLSFDVDINGDWFFLSHEIGHYLQMHLGFVQTFKDYQTEFAKQLLLLNNAYPQNPMPIPSEMSEYASQVDGSLFWLFEKNYFACPEQLSLNEIFGYVQLLIRWQSTAEISNILGIYFNNGTLYLNALSDIRELKRIRYTHGTKAVGNQILKNLGNLPKEIQAFLQGMFAQASHMPLPTEMLELLCQLHDRPFKDADNVVCDFDCYNEKEWNDNVKPVISDFIKAE